MASVCSQHSLPAPFPAELKQGGPTRRTDRLIGVLTATGVAQGVRQQIREELHLTASARVAPNKFLAKIASDWRKPDGLFVIQPKDVENFLGPLQVGRIPGVGKMTKARLGQMRISTVGDLAAHAVEEPQDRSSPRRVRDRSVSPLDGAS